MNNDPIFDEVLDIMGGERRKPYAPNIVPLYPADKKFDVQDDDFFGDLSEHAEVSKAIQDICILWRDMKATDGSFGSDTEKALKEARIRMKSLFDACQRVWDRT